ncbi:unnamed protein product, partial [Oppiella nova]
NRRAKWRKAERLRKEREDKTNTKSSDSSSLSNINVETAGNNELIITPGSSPEPKANGDLSCNSSVGSPSNDTLMTKPKLMDRQSTPESQLNMQIVQKSLNNCHPLFSPALITSQSASVANRGSIGDLGSGGIGSGISSSLRSPPLSLHGQPSFMESSALLKELTANHPFGPSFPLRNSFLSAFTTSDSVLNAAAAAAANSSGRFSSLQPLFVPAHMAHQFAAASSSFPFKALCACCLPNSRPVSPLPPTSSSSMSSTTTTSAAANMPSLVSHSAANLSTSSSTSSVNELRRKAKEHCESVLAQASAPAYKPSTLSSTVS